MLGYQLLESNPSSLTHGQDSQQSQQPKAHQLYHQYHFVQQQQHFQYLQNALASSMNQQSPPLPSSSLSSSQQQQQQQQTPPQQQSPYHANAVFKPNYMQDVLLNETCILNSPLNSMDTSACTTTKTTPLMHPISVHEFDQLPLAAHHHHNHHLHHDAVGIAPGCPDSFGIVDESRKGILPSPSSPIAAFSGNEGRQQTHDEYLNFVTTFSVHPQSTSSLVFRNHHQVSPVVRHSSHDFGSSSSSSSDDNVMATPESSPNRKGLFEDISSRFPVIPSSPTFPAALNLSHGKVAPQKMPKQNGPTLQPPFEIRKITSIKTANSVAKSRGSSGRNASTTIPVARPAEPMKKRLLAKFSSRLLQRMRLSESDTKCHKHCQLEFTNYLELIEHYEDNGLSMNLEARNFNCPVKECPMSIIGYDKRADLRHHVHSDHLTHGLVSAQYTKYSAEIQKYLFVCDDPSCGKGFYRSDTLNRHIKLVHKRTSSHIRKRRKVSNNKSRK